MDKKELRRQIRALKKEHTKAELDAFSEVVCREVMETPQWKMSHCVLLYFALPDEVDTHLLVDEAVREGKCVLLPVVVGDDLILREYHSKEDLALGAYNILEPTGLLFSDYESIDLAIIPGMAFDIEGHRLGRGKGYYDRLLPRLKNAYKTGICFPFQLLPQVPSEPHDVVMDHITSC